MKPWLKSHHLCFAVDDLERAAGEFAAGLGAGPFFVMPHTPFDELLDGDGSECTYEHEHAFAPLGDQLIELTRIRAAAPAGLAAALSNRPVNHVGYLADDLEAASACLVAAGARPVLRGSRGPVRMIYHEVPSLGLVELLQDHPAHEKLSAALAARAAGWDGDRPFRDESPFE
jgi:catechol 2,3-dioxygenase-like lactoylglutathione lyase family enzyme